MRSASPAEAAAIVAALERFMRETAPAPAPATAPSDPWIRAAILEGVGREDDAPCGDRSGETLTPGPERPAEPICFRALDKYPKAASL